MKAFFISLFVALAMIFTVSQIPAQAASDCVGVKVVVLGQTVNACVPTSSLPTVKVTVPVPGPTTTIKVPVPGPTSTVKVPGPLRTVAAPGPTKTVTRTVTKAPATITKAAPRETVVRNTTETKTLAPDPQPTATVTKAGETKTLPGKIVEIEKTVNVSTGQAVGISLILLAIGAILGLLALYASNRYGYFQRSRENVEELQELKDSIK